MSERGQLQCAVWSVVNRDQKPRKQTDGMGTMDREWIDD
jgi:hypothetical protein